MSLWGNRIQSIQKTATIISFCISLEFEMQSKQTWYVLSHGDELHSCISRITSQGGLYRPWSRSMKQDIWAEVNNCLDFGALLGQTGPSYKDLSRNKYLWTKVTNHCRCNWKNCNNHQFLHLLGMQSKQTWYVKPWWWDPFSYSCILQIPHHIPRWIVQRRGVNETRHIGRGQ